ncbi:MAG: cytochrome c biogenesis protein ResB [Pirellulales bacterium]|nr:cytochrome c biogenesis protein ResB [Pirellulales bacterium]
MARPKQHTADQSLPVRAGVMLYEFAASLKLAVPLIFALAAVLGWATFVEREYGTRAVQFGLYGSWWFGLLGVLLALNIFFAAVIRYPWKRYQTGFVITHLGLLTLLFGCLLTRRGGIDAQMAIFEDDAGQYAYSGSERIELAIQRSPGDSAEADGKVQVISIPFEGGPFNWADLERMRRLPAISSLKIDGKLAPTKLLTALPNWVAWNLAPISRGVLYDREGIRVEALDYYSNATEVDAPRLALELSMPRMQQLDSEGRAGLGEESWMPVELAIRDGSRGPLAKKGMGDRQRSGGGNFVLMMTPDAAEVEAFLNSRPDAALPLDGKGQVVLFAAGQRFPIRVEDKLGQPAFPLGDTGLTAEVVKQVAQGRPQNAADGGYEAVEDAEVQESPAVEIVVRRGEEAPRRMALFASFPEFNYQADSLGVYGSYWVDFGEKKSEQLLAGQGGARIDILQGPAQKLYYRYWNRHTVTELGELPQDGKAVNAFKMPVAQLKMRVKEYTPADAPCKVVLPRPFDKSLAAQSALRAVKLRTTVDGKTSDFWLLGAPPLAFNNALSASELRTLLGDNRSVGVSFPLEQIDVGFLIKLDDFERRLDPGTDTASGYASQVDFLNPATGGAVLRDVKISMNAPVDFSDPNNGRSYRLFQESFAGPFRPADSMYRTYYRLHPDHPRRDNLYSSTLTVNYDPGRGVKYLGSLLVVAGIVTMFYMRAYFFKPVQRAEPKAAAVSSPPPREMATI